MILLSIALAFALQSDPSTTQRGALLPSRPFPFRDLGAFTERSLRLAEDRGARAALETLEAVRLTGVVLPTARGTDTVDLLLSRFHVVAPEGVLYVDGEIAGGRADLEAGITLWRGIVEGESDSDVYLAFTESGARGFVIRAEGTVHLAALPKDGSNWQDCDAVLVHESDPLWSADAPEFTCFTDTTSVYPNGCRFVAGERSGVAKSLQNLTCSLALETDYQFFTLFGDLTAAMDYAVALTGAASLRFVTAASTTIELVYLGLWSTPNDPWMAGENGTGAGGLLGELQAAWAGNIPGGANIGHMISGANLGGGVAYVDVLCNTSYGFGVSGNLGGNLSFPVPDKSALNWDLFVYSHEMGHQFGSPHTQDFCPVPLDECYPGACSDGGGCITNGTIMSYCHLCPGGMTNIVVQFHPTCAALIRSRAEAASCLEPTPCDLCECVEPFVTFVTPNTVPCYPAGSLVAVFGCNLGGVTSITVDGVPVDPATFVIPYDVFMTFEMPLIAKTGSVDLVLSNDQGASLPAPMQVVAAANAQLDIEYAGPLLLSRALGAPITVGSGPGDLVFLCASIDLIPSTLPGYVDLDIGNGFTTLSIFYTWVLPSAGWQEVVLPLTNVPLFSHFYVEAAVRRATQPTFFPLLDTNWLEAYVIP